MFAKITRRFFKANCIAAVALSLSMPAGLAASQEAEGYYESMSKPLTSAVETDERHADEGYYATVGKLPSPVHLNNGKSDDEDGYYASLFRKATAKEAAAGDCEDGYYQSIGKLPQKDASVNSGRDGYYATLRQGPQCENASPDTGDGYYAFMPSSNKARESRSKVGRVVLVPDNSMPMMPASRLEHVALHKDAAPPAAKKTRAAKSPSPIVATAAMLPSAELMLPVEETKATARLRKHAAPTATATATAATATTSSVSNAATAGPASFSSSPSIASMIRQPIKIQRSTIKTTRHQANEKVSQTATRQIDQTDKSQSEAKSTRIAAHANPMNTRSPQDKLAKPEANQTKVAKSPRQASKTRLATGDPNSAEPRGQTAQTRKRHMQPAKQPGPQIETARVPNFNKDATVAQGSDKAKDSMFMRLSPDAKLMALDADLLRLKQGELLLVAPHDMVVSCGQQKVAMMKNSIASIIKNGTLFEVRNLYEDHANSIRVLCGQRQFQLYAGEELVLDSDFDSLSQDARHDGIQRRALQTYEIDDVGSALLCEFSEVSLIRHSTVLEPLVKAGDSESRHVLHKVVKMAACLQIVTGGHGAYEQVTE